MNCRDFEELLSAYADGELAGIQRDQLDEHLAICADCQAVLGDYMKIREQLSSLRATPPLPDIRGTTMSKLKMAVAPAKLRRWLRPALVAVPVLIILVTFLSLSFTGAFINPNSIIARALAAIEDVSSYRLMQDGYVQEREEDYLVDFSHIEFEYVSSDRYHFIAYDRYYINEHLHERFEDNIVIGDRLYFQGLYPFAWAAEELEERIPSIENTMEVLDMLVEIERMPDESIDGIDCFHLQGIVDIEKFLEQLHIQTERGLSLQKEWPYSELKIDWSLYWERIDEMWRTKEIKHELWIGKDDYLIRQGKQVCQPLPGQPDYMFHMISFTYKYYDFNEPIVIEPPVTESGELLPGWDFWTLE